MKIIGHLNCHYHQLCPVNPAQGYQLSEMGLALSGLAEPPVQVASQFITTGFQMDDGCNWWLLGL